MARPSWKEIYRVIPVFYRDNGASSPFRFLYPLIYDRKTRADIAFCSREHDFGYGPARLIGSPFNLHRLTRFDWDEVYREALIARGHPNIAATHGWALTSFGRFAWDKFDTRMEDMGWKTYADWYFWASEAFSRGLTYQFYSKIRSFKVTL